MTGIKIPCPNCTDGFISHGDRQARTAKDVCSTCAGTMVADAKTGQTAATSFVPPTVPLPTIAAFASVARAGWLWHDERGDTDEVSEAIATSIAALLGGTRDRAREVVYHGWSLCESGSEPEWDLRFLLGVLDTRAPKKEEQPVALDRQTGEREGWRPATEKPDLGRKIIALYNDGSGANLWFIHDDGAIDFTGWDSIDPLKDCSLWTYLPDDFEFQCETGDEPFFLKPLPAAPRDADRAAGQGEVA